MIKNIIIAVLVVALLGLGIVSLSNGQLVLGASGQTHYQTESFLQGFYGGTSRQLTVSNAGALTIGSGTSISKVVATTTSWNPGSVNPGAATSTEFTVSTSTFSRGGCNAGFSLASSSQTGAFFQTGCFIGTSTAMVSIFVPASSTAAIDLGTSTVTIHQLQF